ncbi:MAG: sulfatase-like hydrolase/transferase, partial [Pirellulales bacterium]
MRRVRTAMQQDAIGEYERSGNCITSGKGASWSKALFLAGFFCAIATLTVSHAAFGEGPTPNIVIVYTDDQAAWALGTAVGRGWFDDVPAANTPNIDRLASEGAVFQNSFCTTPVCSPARASHMTGRYASEFGITDFIPMPGHKLYDPRDQVALDPDVSVTFAEVLNRHEYATGLVGKWHLGDWTAEGSEQFHPTNHGFDYFMGLTGGVSATENPELEEEGQVRKFEGLTTDILTDRALAFIEQSKDTPFLLCLHTRAPHGAWLPVAPEDWAPYEGLDPTIPNPEYENLNVEKMKRQMREYLASTSGVDRNLGRVLELLDRLNLTENTVVMFSSDHGYNMGHNGVWHKGNGIWATRSPPVGSHQGTRIVSNKYRPNLYDHSLRVPMVVRWPGVIAPGTEITQTASSLDVFPTILAMAGVELPANEHLQGRNLLPLLEGESPEEWNQDLYAEYHMINYVEADMRCYRTPHYKLIRDIHNQGRDEFYDLVNDPSESQNLIDDP